MKTAILGGGLTGVALKHFLPEAEILERESRLGGLCRSFCKDGFWYDLGGHILFSKDVDTLSFIISLLGDNAERHYRRNFIWFKKRLVKYPFENGLPDLPLRDRLSCFCGYLARPRSDPKNFGEWIEQRFGKGFGSKYLTPYNEKIWKTPLHEIATGWVERIPDPPLWDLFKGAVGLRTEGYLHQLHFHYPKSGGIESLIKALAQDQDGEGVRLNFDVTGIRQTGKEWIVSDGKNEIKFDRIISTIPVTELAGLLEGVPSRIRTAARRLRCNSLIVAMIGVKSRIPPKLFAVYFPQSELIFHRVCFQNYLGYYAPEGSTSITAEITVPPGDALFEMPDANLISRVVDGLSRENFLKESDIVTCDVRRVRYAYVVDTLERKSCMKEIRQYLDERGVALCGRFAEFEYLNMDACVARARNLARKITGVEYHG